MKTHIQIQMENPSGFDLDKNHEISPMINKKKLNEIIYFNSSTPDNDIGEGLSGELDDSTWTLKIFGEGKMKFWANILKIPWNPFHEYIMILIIGRGVQTIESYAFYNFTGLTTVTFPPDSALTKIESQSFQSCISLQSITIPQNVIFIGGLAFQACHQLSSVIIKAQNDISLGELTFHECFQLPGVIVESTTTNLTNDSQGLLYNKDKSVLIYGGCAKRGEITIPETVSLILEYILAYSNITSLTILGDPKMKIRIDRQICQSCSCLKKITVYKEVTFLGYCSFMFCSSLESATFLSNIGTIQHLIFVGCSKLSEFKYCGTKEPIFSTDLPFFDENQVPAIYLTEKYPSNYFGEHYVYPGGLSLEACPDLKSIMFSSIKVKNSPKLLFYFPLFLLLVQRSRRA